ncbi:hypothetical protein ANHS_459 [Ligilactobacillus ruminis ATCC 25644]|nr:hypothetical protein ANHS_459 [Ligilactobacillus ruminis ATCC 25644]
MDDQCGIFADEAKIPLFCMKMQSRLMRCRCIASGEGTWKALFVLISVPCGFDLGVGVDKN